MLRSYGAVCSATVKAMDVYPPIMIEPQGPQDEEQDNLVVQQRNANAPVWLQRLSLGVLVVFCLYLGTLIAVLPWWKDMWDRNSLLLQHPDLRAVLIKGPVRGLISGLGVLDLWIGLSELIHYSDYRD